MEAMALWHGLGGLATAAGLLLAGAGGMHLLTRQRVRASRCAPAPVLDRAGPLARRASRRVAGARGRTARAAPKDEAVWREAELQREIEALQAARRHVEQALGQQLCSRTGRIGGERGASPGGRGAAQPARGRACRGGSGRRVARGVGCGAARQARVERLPPVSRSAVAAEGRRAGPVRLALRGTGVSGTGADEGGVDLPPAPACSAAAARHERPPGQRRGRLLRALT